MNLNFGKLKFTVSVNRRMDGACHLEFMSHDLCSFRPDVVSCVPSDLLATRSPLFSVERPRFFLVLDGSFG